MYRMYGWEPPAPSVWKRAPFDLVTSSPLALTSSPPGDERGGRPGLSLVRAV